MARDGLAALGVRPRSPSLPHAVRRHRHHRRGRRRWRRRLLTEAQALELTNIGTLFAFVLVSRRRHRAAPARGPTARARSSVPGYPVTPLLSAGCCILLDGRTARPRTGGASGSGFAGARDLLFVRQEARTGSRGIGKSCAVRGLGEGGRTAADDTATDRHLRGGWRAVGLLAGARTKPGRVSARDERGQFRGTAAAGFSIQSSCSSIRGTRPRMTAGPRCRSPVTTRC